jgi:hypothetical protein
MAGNMRSNYKDLSDEQVVAIAISLFNKVEAKVKASDTKENTVMNALDAIDQLNGLNKK